MVKREDMLGLIKSILSDIAYPSQVRDGIVIWDQLAETLNKHAKTLHQKHLAYCFAREDSSASKEAKISWFYTSKEIIRYSSLENLEFIIHNGDLPDELLPSAYAKLVQLVMDAIATAPSKNDALKIIHAHLSDVDFDLDVKITLLLSKTFPN